MEIVWVILIILGSHVIQGITGFAGTLLAMPWSSMVIGFETARGMINLLTISSGLVIVAVSYRYIHWRELGKMVGLMSSGLIIGIGLIEVIDIPLLLKIYGLFVIAIAIHGSLQLRGKRNSIHNKLIPDWGLNVVLFFAGIVHGMYVSGGALVVIYAAIKIDDKQVFRVTVAMIWIILNTIVSFGDVVTGRFTLDMVNYFLIGLGPCLVATYVGMKLQMYFSIRMFLRVTYGLLIVSGVSILI